MGLDDVWRKWFAGSLGIDYLQTNSWGRMIGTPSQQFHSANDIDSLPGWIKDVENKGLSPFISISYYAGHGLLVAAERLMLDLDAKNGLNTSNVEAEARLLTDHLRSFCEPLVINTGGRGFHIHLWLPVVISLEEMSHEDATSLYNLIVEILGINSLQLKSLDPAVIRPSVLSRPPYTRRPNGNTVLPLDNDMKPIDSESFSLEQYILNPLPRNLVSEAVREVLARQAARNTRRLLRKNQGYYAPSSYKWIERVLRTGLPDGRRRFILFVASKYLVNILGKPEDEAVEILLDFAEKSERLPGFCGSGRISSAEIHAYVRSSKTRGTPPPSLTRIAERDPELYKLITQVLKQH